MGIFSKFSVSLKSNKKNNALPESLSPVYVSNDTVKCSTYSYKTLATFDLNIEKPKYEGALPDATIKFYPLN